jgi:hypothetical protein
MDYFILLIVLSLVEKMMEKMMVTYVEVTKNDVYMYMDITDFILQNLYENGLKSVKNKSNN